MRTFGFVLISLFLQGIGSFLFAQSGQELYRPEFHFSPEKNWINDPNGLVYYEGEYHLFYQYNPLGDQWGNMSWGHAVSPDLLSWEELPVAIPVINGVMAFSGSAVIDWDNTSGFGLNGKPPMVALYTAYDGLQKQHVAYSNDNGRTWSNYSGNPVLDLNNDDFRDPKVIWHEPSDRWVMVVVLASQRIVRFYESSDLKNWDFLQDFGQVGDQSGVWECPDLFELPVDGDTNQMKWVLEVDIAPGRSQYFVGDFDGNEFVADKYPDAGAGPLPSGTLIADFEGTDYGNWTTTGTAFGSTPANGALGSQMPVSGFLGNGLANSFLNGDQSTGTLSSPAFTINHKYLNFKIGGGDHPNGTYIALKISGVPFFSSTGSNEELLKWESWDVQNLMGQTATLEIVDNETGSWGHINLDHIFLSDTAMGEDSSPSGAIIEDFESGSYGNWTVLGAAFGTVPANGTLANQNEVTGYLGNALVNSFYNGDNSQGKLISPNFVIDSTYINFLIGGGNHPGSAYIKLISGNNQVIRQSTGNNDEHLGWDSWEVQNYIGQTARIEIVDSVTGGWGHINVDHIIQSNQAPKVNRFDPVDHGMDFYAAQSFSDIPESDGRRIWLAWMSNWTYAGDVPTSPWRGTMTLPRTMHLTRSNNEIVLSQQPIVELEALRLNPAQFQHQSLNTVKGNFDQIQWKTYEILAEIEPGSATSFGFNLKKGNGQQTQLIYEVTTETLSFNRANSGELSSNQAFSRIQSVGLPVENGRVQLRIFVDHSSIEVFANEGKVVLSNLIFPDSSSNGMELFETGGNAFVQNLSIWELQTPLFATSIEETLSDPDFKQVKVYPNPANGTIKIDFGENWNAKVKVYKQSGQLISINRIKNSDHAEIKVGSTGVFIVEILSDTGKKHTIKVINEER